MARITTYATLATAVQDYLALTSVGVASGNLDYLLSEAEEEMNARLRVRRMLTSSSPTVSSTGVVTLPTDFGGWKRFQIRDGVSEWDLELIAAEQTTDVTRVYTQPNGVPRVLITNGATSQILPFTNSTYTFVALYYARIPQLTAAATTNWVIANYPNVYLYGCLAAAAGFVQDMQPAQASRFDQWAKKFGHAIDRINTEDAIDLDARSNTTLTPNTALFNRGVRSNIISGE